MNAQTIEKYRALMANLDPEGPPTAQFVHRTTNPIQQPGQHLGVLDASFNPLTLAHEALVRHAQNAFDFGEMVLFLAKTNVDKDLFGADLGQRLAMMVDYAGTDLSVAGCSHARFVDKAQALHTLCPKETLIYFLVGHDTLIRIFEPRYYTDMNRELRALFALCHIVSANRDDQGQEAFETFMSRPECAPFANRVHLLQLPASFGNISSTQVREKIKTGASITHLLPPAITQSIRALSLYTA
jgi:nicotinamide-nucleotide adenylyltransferase